MKVGIHMLQEVQACERLSEYADLKKAYLFNVRH